MRIFELTSYNLADITNIKFKYFHTFPCNSEHFYCIGAINAQKTIFSCCFSIYWTKCTHKGVFLKFGHIYGLNMLDYITKCKSLWGHLKGLWLVCTNNDIRKAFLLGNFCFYNTVMSICYSHDANLPTKFTQSTTEACIR